MNKTEGVGTAIGRPPPPPSKPRRRPGGLSQGDWSPCEGAARSEATHVPQNMSAPWNPSPVPASFGTFSCRNKKRYPSGARLPPSFLRRTGDASGGPLSFARQKKGGKEKRQGASAPLNPKAGLCAALRLKAPILRQLQPHKALCGKNLFSSSPRNPHTYSSCFSYGLQHTAQLRETSFFSAGHGILAAPTASPVQTPGEYIQ